MPNTNGHGPKRAILYARVSTDEQARSGYSLAQQHEALREYAAREGYEIHGEVQDAGQSGASLERPGMDRVRDLVAAGGVSVVLAQDRDRFAREPAYHYLLKREFAEHGTKIRALNDRGDDSPEGDLTDGILDQLAKYERAKMTERSRRGKLRKAREGKVIAGRMAHHGAARYGFTFNDARDALVVDEEKMAVVRRIFRMVGVEGQPIFAAKRMLDAAGIPTATGKPRWSASMIRDIISNDVYRPHSFEEVEPLVSPEVAARLDPQQSYGLWRWGINRLVRSQVSAIGPDGKRVYWYVCKAKYKHGADFCQATRTHRAEKLEARVWCEVRSYLEEPERLREDLNRKIELEKSGARGEPEREIKLWAEKLAEADAKRVRFQHAYAEGIISLDDLKARLAELDDARATAEREIATMEGRMERVRSLEEDRDAVLAELEAMAPKALDCLDPEERHRFYKMLRLRVRLWPDRSMEIAGAFPEPLEVGAEVCTTDGSRLLA